VSTRKAPSNFAGKSLVILGCGYIGSELARQAVTAGLHVTALTRNREKAALLRESGVVVIEADLATTEWHAALGACANLAVNAISSGRGDAIQRERSYVGGMKSILAWAETAPVSTLVHLSSISVYPQLSGERVDEEADTSGVGARGAVQLATERLLVTAPARVGRWFVLRLAGIYGPGRTVLLEKIRAGQPLSGRPDEALNLIHRDDVCGAIWTAATAPDHVRNEIFNVVDDGEATRAEIGRELAALVAAPEPIFTGEAGTNRVVINDKIERVLGWRPAFASFREGYQNLLSR
jgi:nucleoside-diphosphate-sugar epimerase